jgi:hypothetical protein
VDVSRRDRKRVHTGLAALALAATGLGVAGCTGFRAERHGKDLGQALCDLEGADTAEDVSEATADVAAELERALRIVGRPVGEDVDDIEENLSDLTEHVGQPLLIEQDLANIRRNFAAATAVADASTKRFYEGVMQGLADCTP